jgi:hypothetical protein
MWFQAGHRPELPRERPVGHLLSSPVWPSGPAERCASTRPRLASRSARVYLESSRAHFSSTFRTARMIVAARRHRGLCRYSGAPDGLGSPRGRRTHENCPGATRARDGGCEKLPKTAIYASASIRRDLLSPGPTLNNSPSAASGRGARGWPCQAGRPPHASTMVRCRGGEKSPPPAVACQEVAIVLDSHRTPAFAEMRP